VTAGWVDFSGGDRPVVVLTDEGARVMRSEHPARLLLPPSRSPADRRASGAGTVRVRGKTTIEVGDLDEVGQRLFEALRRHRLELARKESVPPYVVASDRALRDIAALRPRTPAELELAHGIGPAKVAKYGAGFLAVVAETAASAE
jgi:ATP-dependent DNA helicase RecQ